MQESKYVVIKVISLVKTLRKNLPGIPQLLLLKLQHLVRVAMHNLYRKMKKYALSGFGCSS